MLNKVLHNIDNFKVLVTQLRINSPNFRRHCLAHRARRFQRLKFRWLKTMSPRLKNLDLAFQEPWGSFTSSIKPDELHFPNLKHLRLEHFAPSTDESFQWVLKQSTMESLILHDCQIVSRYVMSEQEADRWGFDTGKSDYTFRGSGRIYHFYQYDGTWSEHFDRVGKSLERLTSFSFDGSDYATDSYRQKYHIYQPQYSSILLADSRYTSSSTEFMYQVGPWQGPKEDGELEGLLGEIFPPSGEKLAEENFAGDMAALRRLMESIEDRKLRQLET